MQIAESSSRCSRRTRRSRRENHDDDDDNDDDDDDDDDDGDDNYDDDYDDEEEEKEGEEEDTSRKLSWQPQPEGWGTNIFIFHRCAFLTCWGLDKGFMYVGSGKGILRKLSHLWTNSQV